MDRLQTLATDGWLSAAVAARRTELINGDTGTAPDRRIDRAEVAPGCRIKTNDDVMVNGEIKRVVCPADYPGWFTTLSFDQNGFVWGTDDALQVTDRAPADPEEEPLPIFEEPTP